MIMQAEKKTLIYKQSLKRKSGKVYLVMAQIYCHFFNIERKKEIRMHKINGEQVKI